MVRSKRFLAEYGHALKRNIFYQDNQSEMNLESNGHNSYGEKSRHIHIRYFFIKDVLRREKIELIYCPTERMVANYYTKTLQGSFFRKMRDTVIGITPFLDEERVSSNEK